MKFHKHLSGLLFIIILLMAMVLPIFSLCVHGEDTSAGNSALQIVDYNAQMTASVEEQIRAFAKSINQLNAIDSAAIALAKHGMTGGGKKLSVGKSHELTATLMNSEVVQSALTTVCTKSIECARIFGEKTLYLDLHCGWNTFGYYYEIFQDPRKNIEEVVLKIAPFEGIPGNNYDESLVWIAGSIAADMEIKPQTVTEDTITYNVEVRFWDRFDFSTSSNSSFKNLISGIGALMFREFDWESTVTFELTVPNPCNHSTASYHWTYDSANRLLIPDGSDGFTENSVIRLTYQEYTGNTRPYYHKLDKPVRLCHDKPWVIEYTIRNAGNFVIAPLERNTAQQLSLMNFASPGLMFLQNNVLTNQTTYNCYGTYYNTSISSKITYTFRLENMIDANGNNMIYLTVINQDNRIIVLNKVPMDDHYETGNGTLTLKSEASKYLDGVDFFISYIGNLNYSFHADYFDLKIWEHGKNSEVGDYFTDKVTKPTCSNLGYTTHTCACCGYNYKDTYTAKTNHNFGAWKQTTAPTCANEGTETRTCLSCNAVETRQLPATGHAYRSAITPPTCTEDGYTTHTCSSCKDRYTDTYVKATGHSYGVWTVNKTTTCAQNGEERRDCANCNHYETRVVSATGHSYEAVVTKPTCNASGYTTYTCTACSNSYTDDYLFATGHSYGKWTVSKNATCTQKGEERRNCTNCNHYETRVISATGHSYEAVVTKPTCTEVGYTTHTCPACKSSYNDSYVSAKGHSYGVWSQTKAPFCTANGEEKRTCANCTAFETRKVNATGHSYIATVTKPTCTEVGYTTHTCPACNDSYTDNYVGTKGHSYGAWSQTKAPSCSANGEEKRTCANCTAFETRKVTATGHSYVATVTKPTCTEVGYTTHTCHCGDTYIDSNVSAIGHTHSNWIVDAEPQVGIQGSRHIECTVCKEILQNESINALPYPETETNPQAETKPEIETKPETETKSITESETAPKSEEPKNNEGSLSKVVIGVLSLPVLLALGYLLFNKKRK